MMEVLIGHTRTALCIVTTRDRTGDRYVEVFKFCANSGGFFMNYIYIYIYRERERELLPIQGTEVPKG